MQKYIDFATLGEKPQDRAAHNGRQKQLVYTQYASNLVCRLAQGVSQDDLSGQQVRQQFRSMCSGLVDAVAAVSQATPPSDRQGYQVGPVIVSFNEILITTHASQGWVHVKCLWLQCIMFYTAVCTNETAGSKDIIAQHCRTLNSLHDAALYSHADSCERDLGTSMHGKQHMR